jgi:hypothetical protein
VLGVLATEIAPACAEAKAVLDTEVDRYRTYQAAMDRCRNAGNACMKALAKAYAGLSADIARSAQRATLAVQSAEPEAICDHFSVAAANVLAARANDLGLALTSIGTVAPEVRLDSATLHRLLGLFCGADPGDGDLRLALRRFVDLPVAAVPAPTGGTGFWGRVKGLFSGGSTPAAPPAREILERAGTRIVADVRSREAELRSRLAELFDVIDLTPVPPPDKSRYARLAAFADQLQRTLQVLAEPRPQ